MEQKLTLVAVIAHEMDGIKGCGGTLAKYSKMGHRTGAMILGKGNPKGNGQKAYETIGSELIALDCGLGEEAPQAVAEKLAELKADIVLTHIPQDVCIYGKRMHETVSDIVASACAYMAQKYRNSDVWVKRLLYFLSNMWTTSYLTMKPDVFIDISDTAKVKAEALRYYGKWVGGDTPDILHEHRMVACRQYGIVAGVLYAEGFFLPFDGHPFGQLALDKFPEEWLRLSRLESGPPDLSLPKDFC